MQKIKLRREPDLGVRFSAFPFQAEAIEAIRDLTYAAVFHEQGLGKTKIALDVILYWLSRQVVDSVLIVTKRLLVHNWVREIEAHTHLSPVILSQDRKANYFALNSPSRLFVTHYEVLRTEGKRLSLLQRAREVAAVLDESQKIKNPRTALTEAALELAPGFKRRLILTGTPIANRPQDLWAQIYFLDQGESLGPDFEALESRLRLSGQLAHNEKRRDEFEEELGGLWAQVDRFSVRETKEGAKISLPDKELLSVYAEWEKVQAEHYESVRDGVRRIVVQGGIPQEDRSDELLKKLLRLIQVASNPALVDESYNQVPGKYSVLRSLLDKIVDAGEKAIVWTSFRGNVQWLSRELSDHGAVGLHGGRAMAKRERAIRVFLEDEDCKVLVATPGAAKEGLTLTVANHVVFYDRTFSLDDFLQAQDRIHRISQVKKCFVYSIMMKDSIDEWVDLLLRSKQLAAQLGQGDITIDQYRLEMTYEFGDVLRGVLGLDD